MANIRIKNPDFNRDRYLIFVVYEQWHFAVVSHLFGKAAMEQPFEKSALVGTHHKEINLLAFDEVQERLLDMVTRDVEKVDVSPTVICFPFVYFLFKVAWVVRVLNINTLYARAKLIGYIECPF